MLGRGAGPCGRLRRRFATCPPKRVALLRRMSRLEACFRSRACLASRRAAENAERAEHEALPCREAPSRSLRVPPCLRVSPKARTRMPQLPQTSGCRGSVVAPQGELEMPKLPLREARTGLRRGGRRGGDSPEKKSRAIFESPEIFFSPCVDWGPVEFRDNLSQKIRDKPGLFAGLVPVGLKYGIISVPSKRHI